ncbi:MAG: hypothetical protein CM1200mP27_12160 [Chloroflexota bacterium]|nr:MAG: hypothetical protein CM1200mP27_12160 [Chloroflexota bacterium]
MALDGYGTIGVTKFDDIAVALSSASEVSPALWVGVGLILGGLMFKVSVLPFHMWAPDVYEGAPYPVTAYLAIGSKAAAFALILRLVGEGVCSGSRTLGAMATGHSSSCWVNNVGREFWALWPNGTSSGFWRTQVSAMPDSSWRELQRFPCNQIWLRMA